MNKKAVAALVDANRHLKMVVREQGEIIAIAQTTIHQLQAELEKSKRPAKI